MFYCDPPKNIWDKFTLLQSFVDFYNQLWSSSIPGLSNLNRERMYKPKMDLIPNGWKYIATLDWNLSKTSLKTLWSNNKSTRKVKVFQNLSDKKILQETFQIYISCPTFMSGRKYSQSWYFEKMFYQLVYQIKY